jgi:hypothetical protein
MASAKTSAAQRKLQPKKGSKPGKKGVSGKPLANHTTSAATAPSSTSSDPGATPPTQAAGPERAPFVSTPLAASIIATANGTFVPGQNFEYEQEKANEETRLKQVESEYDTKLQESEVDRTKNFKKIGEYEAQSKSTTNNTLAARGMAQSGAAALNSRRLSKDVGEQTSEAETIHSKAHEAYNNDKDGAVGSLRMKSRLESRMNLDSLAAKKKAAELEAERQFNLNKATAAEEVELHNKEEAAQKAEYEAEAPATPAAPAAASAAAQRVLSAKGSSKAGAKAKVSSKKKVGKKK